VFSLQVQQALPRLQHLHPLALLSTFSVDQIALPHHLDQGAAELVEEDEEEVDEGEDEHDAQDGDEGVRGLPRQERVGVREVDGGALRVALLLHGDQGGQGVGEAKQLSLIYMKTSPRPRGNKNVDDVHRGDHRVAHQVFKAQPVLWSVNEWPIDKGTEDTNLRTDVCKSPKHLMSPRKRWGRWSGAVARAIANVLSAL